MRKILSANMDGSDVGVLCINKFIQSDTFFCETSFIATSTNYSNHLPLDLIAPCFVSRK